MEVNFGDGSDLEDPGKALLAEEPKKWGTTAQGQGQGQARKSPSLQTDAVTTPGSAPRHSGFTGGTWRAKKVASGHGEEQDPKIMRTIPEEKLTNNLMEMNSEILRGSDGDNIKRYSAWGVQVHFPSQHHPSSRTACFSGGAGSRA